jgi:excisionase family DNA binding protein
MPGGVIPMPQVDTAPVTADQAEPRKTRTRRTRPPKALPETGDGLIRDLDAADALGLGRSTLWRLVAAGKLHPVKIGGATRFRISDIRALLA